MFKNGIIDIRQLVTLWKNGCERAVEGRGISTQREVYRHHLVHLHGRHHELDGVTIRPELERLRAGVASLRSSRPSEPNRCCMGRQTLDLGQGHHVGAEGSQCIVVHGYGMEVLAEVVDPQGAGEAGGAVGGKDMVLSLIHI